MNNISVVVFVLLSIQAYGQFSPGDLCKAHSHLEGVENCTKCHPAGEQLANQQCLGCHQAINSLIRANRGYHSLSEVKGKNCWSCHGEHLGRDFSIIKFDSRKFNHQRSGYELKGKHSSLECAKCHKAEFIVDQSLKKKRNTYLGLGRDCLNCHKDFHQGTFGKNCEGCHNQDAFRPATAFDHNRAKFKLSGAHTRVDCIKCHPKEMRQGEQTQKFTGLSFQNCAPCHRDAHEGKFGTECKKCHSMNNFKEINLSNFDHNRTAYPLQGKHSRVKCEDCHGTKRNSHPKHTNCTDCHKDKHNGQLADNVTQITDCSLCHSVNGFLPSSYTLERHNNSRFQLISSHLSIACTACHLKNNEWSFRNIGGTCNDCHTNAHGEEITQKYLVNNECQRCHTIDTWKKISFDHSATNFKLEGIHISQSCARCHAKAEPGGRKYSFKSLGTACETCHTDIHRGQFKVQEHTECLRCHTFDNWTPARFNHGATRFQLTGGHEKVECAKCHKQRRDNNGVYIYFKMDEFRCATCHS